MRFDTLSFKLVLVLGTVPHVPYRYHGMPLAAWAMSILGSSNHPPFLTPNYRQLSQQSELRHLITCTDCAYIPISISRLWTLQLCLAPPSLFILAVKASPIPPHLDSNANTHFVKGVILPHVPLPTLQLSAVGR